jgi:4'-phosphopantetheinyl transferase
MTSKQTKWRTYDGTALPRLGADEVHVWYASLELSPQVLEDLSRTLSETERARAARFVSDSARQHFIAGHGLLRRLLGGYLGRDPSALDFITGTQGKPMLAGPRAEDGELRFNLSHSHGMAAYAIAHNRAVGIDLERIRGEIEAERLSRRFFSAAEYRALQQGEACERTLRFYRYWTCKEAYVKAKGISLILSLARVAIELDPGSETAWASDIGGADPREKMRIETGFPDDEYVLAVTAEGKDWQPRWWRWSEQAWSGSTG